MQPESPQKTNPIKALFRRMWNALRRRPFMKLSAVLLAFTFWAIVIASDPALPIEKTITNVPVSIINQDTLRGRGLTVVDDLSTQTITVKMRVEVKRSDYDKATADAFSPRIDLSQITSEGKQRVYFTTTSTISNTVLSYEPEYIEVEVEPYTSRSRVPVVIQTSGESSPPLWVSNATTDPAIISVSGPKSLVDQVQRAVVDLPLASLSANRPQDSVSSLLELQDAEGGTILSPLLRMTSDSITVDSANINMNVYPMQEIPVQVESATVGYPAHGHTVSDVRIEPETILVAAEQEVLDSIEALYVSTPVDVSGLDESLTATSTLRSTAGVIHMTTSEVTIETDIVSAMHVHTYTNLPVTIMRQDDPSLSAKLSNSEMDVIISGNYDVVQGLSPDDITMVVDAYGLGEGAHLVDVRCVINGVDQFVVEAEFPRIVLTLEASGSETE